LEFFAFVIRPGKVGREPGRLTTGKILRAGVEQKLDLLSRRKERNTAKERQFRKLLCASQPAHGWIERGSHLQRWLRPDIAQGDEENSVLKLDVQNHLRLVVSCILWRRTGRRRRIDHTNDRQRIARAWP